MRSGGVGRSPPAAPAPAPAPAPLGWLGAPPARPFHSSPRRALPSPPARHFLPPAQGPAPPRQRAAPPLKGQRRAGGASSVPCRVPAPSCRREDGERHRLPPALLHSLCAPHLLIFFLFPPWDTQLSTNCSWKREGRTAPRAKPGSPLRTNTRRESSDREVAVSQATFTGWLRLLWQRAVTSPLRGTPDAFLPLRM